MASFVAGLLQQPPAPIAGNEGPRTSLPLLSIGVSTTLPTLALTQLSDGVPLGYVRLLVFDANSNLVGSQTVTQQLSAAAASSYEPLRVQVKLQQDGYVIAYVGNESNADVYFDDVEVIVDQGLQVQENEYDPAGLELAGLVSPSPGIRGLNNYRFNGKEFQADLGLTWNHQDWRYFDPQLLRWHSGDPELENEQESWTPYSFAYDNAIRYADTNGRAPGGGITMPVYEPQWAIYELGAGVVRSVTETIDRFYAFVNHATSQTMAETPRGTVAGVNVRGTSTVEEKAETKYQPTLSGAVDNVRHNRIPGPLYTSTTTVKVTKIEKAEVSGKVRGLDVKESVSVKTDVKTRA
nr:hypothetical protein [Tanacetum cinerariifolium]